MRRALVSIAILISCGVSEVTLAGNEANYPKPGDPRFGPMLRSIKDRITKSEFELERCVHRFVDKKVTSESDSQILARQACFACERSDRDLNDAQNDLIRFTNGWNPSYQGDNTKDKFPFKAGLCAKGAIYAYSAIEHKNEEKKKSLEPILEAAAKLKLKPAMECNQKYSVLFALTTVESPENIAKAGFANCQSLFDEAAEARINPVYTGNRRAEMVKGMMTTFRDHALEQTITVTVESRARKQIGPSEGNDKMLNQNNLNSKI
jgi:hypothetical protein